MADINPISGVEFGKEKTRGDHLARATWELEQASKIRAGRKPVGWEHLVAAHERTANAYTRRARELAGRGAHSTKKADYDWSSFTDGAAKGLWTSPYITEVENLAETAREQEDPRKRDAFMQAYRELSPGPGGSWERVMPDPPAAAKALAKKFTKAVREKLTPEELAEVFGAYSAEDAGYYGAMQSQGEGVGWFDKGVDADPPEGFQWDPKVQNAVYAAVARGAREAGIKLPRR